MLYNSSTHIKWTAAVIWYGNGGGNAVSMGAIARENTGGGKEEGYRMRKGVRGVRKGKDGGKERRAGRAGRKEGRTRPEEKKKGRKEGRMLQASGRQGKKYCNQEKGMREGGKEGGG
jgi:hypothetical protein